MLSPKHLLKVWGGGSAPRLCACLFLAAWNEDVMMSGALAAVPEREQNGDLEDV